MTTPQEALAAALDDASVEFGSYDWDWYKDQEVAPLILATLASAGYSIVPTPDAPRTETPDLRAALDDAASHDGIHTCSSEKVHRHLRALRAALGDTR